MPSAPMASYTVPLQLFTNCRACVGVTTAVPVSAGDPLTNAISRSDIAGSDTTRFLSHILCEHGVRYMSVAELETVRCVCAHLSFSNPYGCYCGQRSLHLLQWLGCHDRA